MRIPIGARGPLVAVLLVSSLLLAGCGADATPTTVPTAVPPTNTAVVVPPTNTAAAAPATNTVAPAPATNTSAPATATNTVAAVPATDTAPAVTPTEMMGPATPTGAAGASTPTAAAPTPAPTPVSQWVPGAHKNTIPVAGKLKTGGKLTIGSDVSYPPQEYMDSNSNPVGLDIDVGNEIASRLGLDPTVVNFKFDSIIPALNAGQFDVVISAMSVTTDRQAVVDFVPYFEAGQAVLVKKGNPKNIKTLDDLSGKTAVAEQGTVEEDTLKALNDKFDKAGKPKVNALSYPTDTDAVDQLRVGRADATLHDSPVAAYYAKLNPNDFEVAIADFASAPEGIAVAKGNRPLYDAVNKAIDAMTKDGTLAAIKAKWGITK